METNTQPSDLHVFERAGLGKAPFRVIGCEVKRGPIRISSSGGTEHWVGAPGQPMGTCDFCGQGIAECWSIRSADGRVFTVGCDCVSKTGDAGLRRGMSPYRIAASHARDDARIARCAEALQRQYVQDALAAQESPTGRGTALDWAKWMMVNAGRAGKVRVARVVEALDKAPAKRDEEVQP